MKTNRRSIRLKGYDYSQEGAYFVTICTYHKNNLFGEICDGKMVFTNIGKIAEQCWNDIPKHFFNIKLDEFIIMPNHVHGILMIAVGAKNFSPLQPKHACGTSKTIGSIIRGFKIGVTKWVRTNTNIKIIWQRNYYEHIIRNDHKLNQIRQYIINNPLIWDDDKNNPKNMQQKNYISAP